LEDLLIAHGGFDGDMSRAEAVKLDDQFGSSLQIKLTTLESSTKYTIVYWTYSRRGPQRCQGYCVLHLAYCRGRDGAGQALPQQGQALLFPST